MFLAELGGPGLQAAALSLREDPGAVGNIAELVLLPGLLGSLLCRFHRSVRLEGIVGHAVEIGVLRMGKSRKALIGLIHAQSPVRGGQRHVSAQIQEGLEASGPVFAAAGVEEALLHKAQVLFAEAVACIIAPDRHGVVQFLHTQQQQDTAAVLPGAQFEVVIEFPGAIQCAALGILLIIGHGDDVERHLSLPAQAGGSVLQRAQLLLRQKPGGIGHIGKALFRLFRQGGAAQAEAEQQQQRQKRADSFFHPAPPTSGTAIPSGSPPGAPRWRRTSPRSGPWTPADRR